MAKRKDKSQIINNIQELNLEFDYDKLAQAIVKAKQIEEENAAKKKAADLEEWKKILGVNKHEDKKGIKKKIYVFCNNVKVFFNLIFFSKKKESPSFNDRCFYAKHYSCILSLNKGYALDTVAGIYHRLHLS